MNVFWPCSLLLWSFTTISSQLFPHQFWRKSLASCWQKVRGIFPSYPMSTSLAPTTWGAWGLESPLDSATRDWTPLKIVRKTLVCQNRRTQVVIILCWYFCCKSMSFLFVWIAGAGWLAFFAAVWINRPMNSRKCKVLGRYIENGWKFLIDP